MVDYENGINGANGKYLFPIRKDKEIANQARKVFTEQANIYDQHLNDLKERGTLTKAPAAWVDPTDLSRAGWGAIFAPEYPGYTLEDLKSPRGLGLLLEHRKKLATQACDNYFKTFTFDSKWDKSKFLLKHKVPISGAVDPDRGMPYPKYLTKG